MAEDEAFLRRYATLAKTEEGFAEVLARWLDEPAMAAE